MAKIYRVGKIRELQFDSYGLTFITVTEQHDDIEVELFGSFTYSANGDPKFIKKYFKTLAAFWLALKLLKTKVS